RALRVALGCDGDVRWRPLQSASAQSDATRSRRRKGASRRGITRGFSEFQLVAPYLKALRRSIGSRAPMPVPIESTILSVSLCRLQGTRSPKDALSQASGLSNFLGWLSRLALHADLPLLINPFRRSHIRRRGWHDGCLGGCRNQRSSFRE